MAMNDPRNLPKKQEQDTSISLSKILSSPKGGSNLKDQNLPKEEYSIEQKMSFMSRGPMPRIDEED